MKGTKKQSKRQSKKHSKKQSKKHRQKGGGVPSVIRNIMEFLNTDDGNQKNNETRTEIYKILIQNDDDKWNKVLGKLPKNLTAVDASELNKIDEGKGSFSKSVASMMSRKTSYTPLEANTALDSFLKTYQEKAVEEEDAEQFIECVKPPFIVVENVVGVAANNNSNRIDGAVEKLIQKLSKINYQISQCYLDAADYDVPQRRKRCIIIGAKAGYRLPDCRM